MAKNTVLAVVAIVIIAVAAIGAYALMNNGGNDDGVSGKYNEYMVNFAVLNDGVVSYGTDKAADSMTIEKTGNIIKGNWDGDEFTGTYSNGFMNFTCSWEVEGIKLSESGYATVKDGVIYYTSLSVTEDNGAVFALSAIFVKEGKTYTPAGDIDTDLKKGTVFESYKSYSCIDGEYTVDGKDSYTITVADIQKGIAELDNRLVLDGRVFDGKALAIYTGNDTFIMTAGVGEPAYIVTDGITAEVVMDFDKHGTPVTKKFLMTSTERQIIPASDGMSGKVYKGTMDLVKGSKTYSYGFSVMFGDGEGFVHNATMSLTDGKDTYTYMKAIALSLCPSGNGGYFVMFNDSYTIDELDIVEMSCGYITDDLKNMTINTNLFLSDGTSGSEIALLSLTDEIGILGTYNVYDITSAIMNNGEVTVKTELDTQLQITAFDGTFVTAVWDGSPLYGTYNYGYIDFGGVWSYGGETYREYAKAFYYGGVIYYGSITKNADGTTTAATSVKFVKDGVNVAPAEYDVPLKQGDSYMSFKSTESIDGTITDTTGSILKTVTAKQVFGEVAVLENCLTIGGEATVDHRLAVFVGNNTYLVGYPSAASMTVMTFENEVVHWNTTKNDDSGNKAYGFVMSKYGTEQPFCKFELDPMTCSGYSSFVSTEGYGSGLTVCASFVKDRPYLQIKVAYGDSTAYEMTAHIMKMDGYYGIMYNEMNNGTVGYVSGWLTEDLSKMVLNIVLFSGTDGVGVIHNEMAVGDLITFALAKRILKDWR